MNNKDNKIFKKFLKEIKQTAIVVFMLAAMRVAMSASRAETEK